MKKVFPLLLFIVLISASLYSQDIKPVTFSVESESISIKKGQRGEVVVIGKLAPDHHISAAGGGMFKITPPAIPGIVFGEPEYPLGEEEEYVGYVYRGTVRIPVPFVIESGAAEGLQSVSLKILSQACAEKTGFCYPPETQKLEFRINVLPGDGDAIQIASEQEGIAGRLERSLAKGSWLAFLIVFLGGVLTSLTPCVYPMIPITVAVIGAQAAGGRFRGFVLSLFYVLGIAITFSILGIIAAKTGGLFGAFSQHPVVIALIAVIFFVMGLSMLGVFVMQMPSSLATKLQGKRRSGYIGAMLTGLVAGLVVSPCISPLLVVILTWVAKTGSVLLGVGLLFTFALGLGVLFVVIGTFSGVIKNLPKSGGWMELIERGFGTLLVVLAIVFLRSILPQIIYIGVWSVFLVLFGTFTGAFTPLEADADKKRKLGKAAGILAVIIGASFVFWSVGQRMGFGSISTSTVQTGAEKASPWLPTDEEGFRQARSLNKPILMDFFAEWCPGCHELDEKTWPDPAVQEELDRFVLVKLDLTKNDSRTQAYHKKYKIIGMPTVIFFDPQGNELGRFEGYRPPEQAVQILKKY